MSRDLYKLDEAPLLGNPPPFPWDKLSQDIAKCFNLEGFSIVPGELTWREKDAILAGIAEPNFCTQIVANGLEGEVTFWISKKDVELLMAKILGLSNVVSEMQAADLSIAFHRFLTIQAIAQVNSLDFDKRLSFKITSHAEVRPDHALCQDLTLKLGKENIACRLVIPDTFRKSYKTFFLKSSQPQAPMLDEIQTTVHIEAGRSFMTLQELYSVKLGDFISLDQVYYSPDAEKSRLILTLNGKPLFRARLKDGSLKILEIPLHSEVQDSMTDKINPTAAAANVNQPIEPQQPPHEDENPFPDEEEDEDEGMDLVEQAAHAEQVAAKPAQSPKPAPVQQVASQSPGKLTANDIPIQLVVEVGAVNVTIQKLLELAPGNLIDLDLNPEHGVNLVVNGKIIGKAELLKIGESIGVRVLEIGLTS